MSIIYLYSVLLVLQVVPILRAGLALMEHASSVLPATKTYHLGKKDSCRSFCIIDISSCLYDCLI